MTVPETEQRLATGGDRSDARGLTPDERATSGRMARAEVPRASHAEWAAATERADPVRLFEEQAETRVPELVPIRRGRMLASPFAFFRGAACVMASDLAGTPRSGMLMQLCGDAHLSNLGGFACPEREFLFDLNDFDETLPGPWEWDGKRLAASFVVAGRDRGLARFADLYAYQNERDHEALVTAVRTGRLIAHRGI
jgi:hypothetical protein